MLNDKRLIIAVDFDGTLCDFGFPSTLDGKPVVGMIELVKERKRQGHYMILWTCREGEKLEDAKRFCELHGLEFDSYNENSPMSIEMYGESPRKVHADIYIDDKVVDYYTLKRLVIGY